MMGWSVRELGSVGRGSKRRPKREASVDVNFDCEMQRGGNSGAGVMVYVNKSVMRRVLRKKMAVEVRRRARTRVRNDAGMAVTYLVDNTAHGEISKQKQGNNERVAAVRRRGQNILMLVTDAAARLRDGS